MDATAQANGGALLPRHSTRARRDSHYIIEQREGQQAIDEDLRGVEALTIMFFLTGRFSGVRRRDLNFELWFQKLEHFGVFLHLFSFPVR